MNDEKLKISVWPFQEIDPYYLKFYAKTHVYENG